MTPVKPKGSPWSDVRRLVQNTLPDVASTPAQRSIGWERLKQAQGGQRQTMWLRFAGASLVAVAVACFVWLRPSPPLTYQVQGAAVTTDFINAQSDHAYLTFSDDTLIHLQQGSQARVRNVTSKGAEISIESGSMAMTVTKRAGARWSVNAGPYIIRITGTKFDVSWTSHPSHLEVTLHEGHVVVQGPSSATSVLMAPGFRLIADKSTGFQMVPINEQVPRPVATVVATAVEPSSQPPAVVQSRTKNQAPPSVLLAPSDTSWPALVRRGQFEQVLQLARRQGLDRCLSACGAEDLWAVADAARYFGQVELSTKALMSHRRRFARSMKAPMAAFLLGRHAEDSGGGLADAQLWYASYMREAPGGPLAGEALGRQMVVLEKLGRTAEAQAAAKRYVMRFEGGSYEPVARTLLQGR